MWGGKLERDAEELSKIQSRSEEQRKYGRKISNASSDWRISKLLYRELRMTACAKASEKLI